jgi:hypothetical protein
VIATDFTDLRVVRQLAKHVGAASVATEAEVSIISLRPVSDWARLDGVVDSWRELLPAAVPTVVLLKADHRPPWLTEHVTRQLSAPNLTIVALQYAELENYLLDADTIARASGAAPEAVAIRLAASLAALREATRAAFSSSWVKVPVSGRSSVQAVREAEQAFDRLWHTPSGQLALIRAADVIASLNLWLEQDGYRPITALSLARAIKPQVLASELFEALLRIDELARG